MTKDIIIMAKSTKHYPNYCIAGIDMDTGKWIRPISDNIENEGAVFVEDCTYEDGSEAQVLDVIRTEFVKHYPDKAQNENYLYDEGCCWEKLDEISIEDVIMEYLDSPDFIFLNNERYLESYELNGESLLLVKIFKPVISVFKSRGKRKVSINFIYNGHQYNNISVGDRELMSKYICKKYGNYSLGESRFGVFSLTGRFLNGKYYKMLAQLF